MRATSSVRYPYFRSTIIFIVICSLCLISLITETSTQPIQKFIKEFFSFITVPIYFAKDYINKSLDTTITAIFHAEKLQRENQSLKEELTKLRLALIEKNESIQKIKNYLNINDIKKEKFPQSKLIPANVVEIYRGTLRIDKGTKDGVTVSQGVIAPEGVVGIIIETSPYTSVVATLHNKNCRIGAMIERTRLRAYDGVIFPAGDFRKVCTMNYIDIYETVKIGDLIVTSPESLFPAGIPIGKIQAIHETGTMWKTADIIPIVDPYNLDVVYVLETKIDPLDSVYVQNIDEANTETSKQLPIQELLAP
ncbi:MAG: rod shape-determining protein MreC [Candidatus Hydrogenedentes bacterium]|nr:rod shape-determining protein MreC [Candidatus Hydrogenedentota bacterium]